MPETKIGLPDKVASESTPNESSVAKADMAPKLDLKPELDRKGVEAPIASDTPRRPRKLRAVTSIVALLAVLGIGWGAGLKTQEFVSLGQASTWFQNAARVLVSNLDVQRKQIMTSIEGLASTSASRETVSSDGPRNTAEVIDHVARGLFGKIDQVRASSAAAIGDLGMGIERLHKSMERSQRDVLAKLDQLQERLERVENAGASRTKEVQPLEKPAPVKPAPLPFQPSAPPIAAGAPKPTIAPAQIKRIENWEVMEVVDGTAILAGPRGIIEVSSGDVVPGVGRVEFDLPPRGKVGSRHQQGRDHGPIKRGTGSCQNIRSPSQRRQNAKLGLVGELHHRVSCDWRGQRYVPMGVRESQSPFKMIPSRTRQRVMI